MKVFGCYFLKTKRLYYKTMPLLFGLQFALQYRDLDCKVVYRLIERSHDCSCDFLNLWNLC